MKISITKPANTDTLDNIPPGTLFSFEKIAGISPDRVFLKVHAHPEIERKVLGYGRGTFYVELEPAVSPSSNLLYQPYNHDVGDISVVVHGVLKFEY